MTATNVFNRIFGGAALLCAFATPTIADTISPSTFSATIANAGGSVTVNKVVTVTQQLTSPLDILFLVDTTGSMSASLAGVSAGFSSIATSVLGVAPNASFGVAEYKDFGMGDPFTYRLDTNIGATFAQDQAALSGLSGAGGGDLPEAGLYGLQQAATTTAWRAGSQRFVVWVGDAPSHDPAGPTAVTEAQATAALIANGINVFAASATTGPGLDASCGSAPGSPTFGCTANQALRIATATSGSDLGVFNPATLSAAIQADIVAAITTYTSVSLGAVGLPAGVTATFSAPVTGSFDRSITRMFNLSATFTGTTAGTYDFGVAGLVDGRSVATETDHLVVGAVSSTPEPSTLMMLASGMIAILVLGGRVQRRNKA
jgi:hypothetical protein